MTTAELPIEARERAPIYLPHISWGAIFAGALVSVGLWLLLHLLGMGIGLVAIDPNEQNSFRAIGIGTGIWTIIAPVIALFVGGLVTGRVAGVLSRMTGAIHGAVLWSLGTVATLLVLSMLISSLIGSLAQTGASVVSATAAGVQGTASAAQQLPSLSALGLSSDDLLAPMNEQLRERGASPVTAQQLERAAQEALQRAVRTGQLDRELLVSSIASETAISREEASSIAADIERAWSGWSTQLSTAAQDAARQAEQAALSAADQTGEALLWLFAAMLAGLAAAIAGATLSVGKDQRTVITTARRPYATHTPASAT